MRTIDHLLLGRYLLARSASPALHRHCHAFLLGCVEPDYNVLSYLRGIRHGEKLRGHNAENSSAFLARCMADFEENGLSSTWDYFRLGTMLHYAADAFTAPHNRFYGEPAGAPRLRSGAAPEVCGDAGERAARPAFLSGIRAAARGLLRGDA